MQTFSFVVRGSQGDAYRVTFDVAPDGTTSSCNCRAGLMGQRLCKHREAILDGDVSALLAGNTDDFVALREGIRGTELEAAFLSRRRSAQSRLLPFAAEDRVAVVTDIAGTGIKAGHVGLVTFVQHSGREIGYSTDLAPTAYLVRFSGGAEIWMTAEELAPAADQPLTKGAPSQSARDRRIVSRTRFRDGMAEGWAFGVTEGFKAALDIIPTARALSERPSQSGEPLVLELRRIGIEVSPDAITGDRHALAHLATSLHQAGIVATDFSMKRLAQGDLRVMVTLETEGCPPAYAFAAGDIMHEPAAVHRLPWNDAALHLRRSVQVEAATPDRAAEGADRERRAGSITATIRRYANGVLISSRVLVCSQAEFVRLLKDGVEPGGAAERASEPSPEPSAGQMALPV